jgi:aminocarboxymuconate-semialdehyde decarboxylase
MKIDLHTHCYPKEYLEELEKIELSCEKIRDSSGKERISFYGAILPEWNSEKRIRDMDEGELDMQILSLSWPNVYFQDEDISLKIAITTNDYLSKICKEYPDRFRFFASIPLVNVEYGIKELNRVVNLFGMSGITIGSNVLGKPLNSREFFQFYEEVNRLGLSIFLHPMTPAGVDVMKEYMLIPLQGFVFETTLAATRMVFSGIFERYKNINLILPHLGGTLPFLFERINFGFDGYPSCRENISISPTEYFKKFYYDTALGFHKPAFKCTYDSVGVEHILFGTDYPMGKGFIQKSISYIESLGLSDEERDKIYEGNVRRILRI